MFSILLILVAAASGPAPSALGAVEIRSTPGAEVLWEGITIGTIRNDGTLLVEQVPRGSYAVGLRKEGFVDRDVRVEIEAGTVSRLHMLLRRVPPPRPEPAPAPRREPIPTAAPQPPPQVEESKTSVEESQPPSEEPEPTPEGVADAARGEETKVPEPETGSFESALTPSLLALFALVGGLGLYFGQRRLQPVPRAASGRRAPSIPPEEKIVSQTEDDTGFIQTLKEQERNLDDVEPGSWRREPDIIEAEYVELFEAQEE